MYNDDLDEDEYELAYSRAAWELFEAVNPETEERLMGEEQANELAKAVIAITLRIFRPNLMDEA